MSKILPSGDTTATIFKDISIYSLNTINIGQFSAKSIKGIENVIIGKNAGENAFNVSKSIYIGVEVYKNISLGFNNISIGSDYIDKKNIYDIDTNLITLNAGILSNCVSIGYNTTLNNNCITIGNNNSNIHDINLGFENNGLNLLKSEIKIKNFIINDSEINLGFSNLGVSNLNIGNYNSNINSINIGFSNTSIINNSIIIGNNINNYKFSLNIDNFICKYNTCNIIYLGINFYKNTPIIIGSNIDNNFSTKDNIFFNNGFNTGNIKFTNNNNYSIVLKNSENTNSNIIYNFPNIRDNLSNMFLSTDINGELIWRNINDKILLNIITSGNAICNNLVTKIISGSGNLIKNINFDGNTTDILNEGQIQSYYKNNRFNDIFYSNLNLISSDYIPDSNSSNNFYFSNKLFLKYFDSNIKLITSDNINQGIDNKFYNINNYSNISSNFFNIITTDLLTENSNKYFIDSNFNIYTERLFNNSKVIDKIIEGSNNFYYTDKRYFESFNNYFNLISTDDIIEGKLNKFNNSNITNEVINNSFNKITTDAIKEGSNNKFITLFRIVNIFDSNLNSSDKIKASGNNKYYNINNEVELKSDFINQGISNIYFDSNIILSNIINSVNTNNIQNGTVNKFINETKIKNIFTSMLNNNITSDDISITKKSKKKFIQNNSYDDNINIVGNLKVQNINNFNLDDLIKKTEAKIGELTDIAYNYEFNNITFNSPNNIIDIKYNSFNSNNTIGCNLNVPFIVVNDFVGINKINPNFNLDVNGIVNASNYIGDGTLISNLQWNNILYQPFKNINYSYFNVSNNELELKSIKATNNEIPIIYTNNNLELSLTLPLTSALSLPLSLPLTLPLTSAFPSKIGLTNDYYYIFTNKFNTIVFSDNIQCSVFMIGGGGGGGGYYGGGGGAGSYFLGTLNFNKNIVYNINVGLGGLGANPSTNFAGLNGEDSSITYNNNVLYSVKGGGCGASGFIENNLNINGGCGGGGKGFNLNSAFNINNGGSNNDFLNNGFSGGLGYFNLNNNYYCGGGGGGIGSIGGDSRIINNNIYSGDGGNGLNINIIESNLYFGGGGGGAYDRLYGNFPGNGGSVINNNLTIKCGGNGSGDRTNPNGENGIEKGSGGGGGCGINGNGGNGSSGCIILKFNLTNYVKFNADYDNKNLPSYTWKNNENTGMYFNNNIIGFSINSVNKFEITESNINGNGYGLSNLRWGNLINIPSSITSIFESNSSLNNIFISSNIFTNIIGGYLSKTDTVISPWVKNNNNIYYDNNVGIGIGNPFEKLEVNGNVKITNNISKNYVYINPGNTINDIGYISFYNNNLEVGYIGKKNNNYLYLGCYNGLIGYQLTGNLYVSGNGKIGIGVTSPSNALEVIGNAKISQNISINTDIISTPLTVNNIVNNRNIYNHNSNGSVATFTNTITNGKLNDNYPIIHLCRDGFFNNYGLKSTICLSRWESNGINSRTKINFLLSHNNYNDESNVFSLYSDGTAKILNKLIIGDSNLGYLELTGTENSNKYNLFVSSNNDLIYKYNLNDILSINTSGINGLKSNLFLNNLNINWSNIKNSPSFIDSSTLTNTYLSNYLTLNSFNYLVDCNQTNFITKNQISYYLNSNDIWNFLINKGLDQVSINRIIQDNIGGFYFNNNNTFAIGTDTIKDYDKKLIVNGDLLIDNGNIFINNLNTKPIIKINNNPVSLNEYDKYYYYRFFNTDNNINTITFNDYVACDIYIVGGGGNSINYGGGGGGEVIYLKNVIFNIGTYNLYVGNSGENTYISDIDNNNIYTALAGGNGGYSTVSATNGGSGGGSYLNNDFGRTLRGTDNFGNDGGYGSKEYPSYSGGGGGAGIGFKGIPTTYRGGEGYKIELNGEIFYLGAGGDGAYNTNTSYTGKVAIPNTGMGGSASSIFSPGSAGTIIIKIIRSYNINNLYITSNNFLNCINTFGGITSNNIKNILTPYITNNSINDYIKNYTWASCNNNIYYNNFVGIGGIPTMANINLQVFGKAFVNNFIASNIDTSNLNINGNNIQNIFVSSNVFPSLNNSYGIISSNILKNILYNYVNLNNVSSYLKPSQWDNLNNSIIYNNDVITNKLFYNNNLPNINQNNNIRNFINIQNTNEYYYIFDSITSTYNLNITNSHNLCDILIVGPGGNGGIGKLSGGGGAGEVIYIKNYVLKQGYYEINVGNLNKTTTVKLNNNILFNANVGGTGSSIFYNNNINYQIIPSLKLWALYSAKTSDSSNLYDISGNNRHAILNQQGFSYTTFNNSIYTINGTSDSIVTFPIGSIPVNFTYLIIANYNGNTNGTILKSEIGNSYFGFKDGNIGIASLYESNGNTQNLTNPDLYNTFKSSINYNNLNYIFIKNDSNSTFQNISINGVKIGKTANTLGDSNDRLIINNSYWSLANLFIWDSILTDDNINYIYDNICVKFQQDYISLEDKIYNSIPATTGGSGGGGIVNSVGVNSGIPWKINNTNISYLNLGNKGTPTTGGGGGGAGGVGYSNIGGSGKIINITGTDIIFGEGGNGANAINFTPNTKNIYGAGGDANNGVGYQGIVIIKFYLYADLDNFYITNDNFTSIALANNIVNSNVLQNYLSTTKYITSYDFTNLVFSNNIINSNVLNNVTSFYISSNILNQQNFINSNFIQNSISADFIKPGNSNKFIVNNSYNNDITFAKNVFSSNIITSNLFVIDNYSIFNTSIYETEQLQIVNYTPFPALVVNQKEINQNVVEFYNFDNPNLIINKNGYIGIGTNTAKNLLHLHNNINGSVKIQLTDNLSGTSLNSGFIISKEQNQDVKLINFYSNANIILGSSSKESLIINSNGFIGIGLSNPLYKLHVANGNSSSPLGINYSYFNNISNAILSNNTSNFENTSAYFEGSIICNGSIVSSSDSRIKKDISNIDNYLALQKILLIQPKKYKYIDSINKGDNIIYGFIAEEIKEILPEAVSLSSEIIPNIYKFGYYSNSNSNSNNNDNNNNDNDNDNDNNITINYDNNDSNDSNDNDNDNNNYKNNLILNNDIDIINEYGNKDTYKITNIKNNNTFSINKKINTSNVFIYGTKINDFHRINKDYIYTMNISATQELYKIIQEQNERINNLERKIEEIIQK
jgi:hypothetical protein